MIGVHVVQDHPARSIRSQRRDGHIAQPHRLLDERAGAGVFTCQMPRFVIHIERCDTSTRALDPLPQRVVRITRGRGAIGGGRHSSAVVVRERGPAIGERVARGIVPIRARE